MWSPRELIERKGRLRVEGKEALRNSSSEGRSGKKAGWARRPSRDRAVWPQCGPGGCSASSGPHAPGQRGKPLSKTDLGYRSFQIKHRKASLATLPSHGALLLVQHHAPETLTFLFLEHKRECFFLTWPSHTWSLCLDFTSSSDLSSWLCFLQVSANVISPEKADQTIFWKMAFPPPRFH